MTDYVCLHCGKGFSTPDNIEHEVLQDNLDILNCPFCKNAAFQCTNRIEYSDIKNRVEKNTRNIRVIDDFRIKRLNRSVREADQEVRR